MRRALKSPNTFRNIDRDFRERLESAISQGGWSEYCRAAVRWAFMPVVKVEQQFQDHYVCERIQQMPWRRG